METGDNVLIGGFIVTGTQPKKVIVRAIGPSLPVAGKLVNPTLELYTGQTLLESNDNWMNSPNKQAIIDSTVPPKNDLESAIVRTLPANGAGYTAIVRGAGGSTGIGLVEVYDLDRTVDSKLANISSHGLVQTGDNAMIGGFIISGASSQKVIVRAIGPSLTLPGKLANPTLELYNGNAMKIATNNKLAGDAGGGDHRQHGAADERSRVCYRRDPPANSAHRHRARERWHNRCGAGRGLFVRLSHGYDEDAMVLSPFSSGPRWLVGSLAVRSSFGRGRTRSDLQRYRIYADRFRRSERHE